MASTQNSDRADIQNWLEEFHAASATLSAEHWCNNFFTSDITFQFGNYPPVTGLSEVRDNFFRPQLAMLDEMEHFIEYFDFVAPRIYQAARIRYRVKGDEASGSQDITIPGFAVFSVREESEGGKLLCYHMETYLDSRPLERRIQEVSGKDVN